MKQSVRSNLSNPYSSKLQLHSTVSSFPNEKYINLQEISAQIQGIGLFNFLKNLQMESNEITFDEIISQIEDESKIGEVIHVRRYKDAIYIGDLGAD